MLASSIVKYSQMVAELRTMGDKIALYTDENQVYRRLRKGIPPLYMIPYFQHGRPVGFDLYFDRKLKRTVVQIMKGQLVLNL